MQRGITAFQKNFDGAISNRPLDGITVKQKEFMDFVIDYMGKNHVSPSYEEIRIGLGLASKSGVNRLVEDLFQRGAITYRPHRPRTIRPTQDYIQSSLSFDLLDLIFKIGVHKSAKILRKHLRSPAS